MTEYNSDPASSQQPSQAFPQAFPQANSKQSAPTCPGLTHRGESNKQSYCLLTASSPAWSCCSDQHNCPPQSKKDAAKQAAEQELTAGQQQLKEPSPKELQKFVYPGLVLEAFADAKRAHQAAEAAKKSAAMIKAAHVFKQDVDVVKYAQRLAQKAQAAADLAVQHASVLIQACYQVDLSADAETAASSCRVSTTDQQSTGLSELDRQVHLCEAYHKMLLDLLDDPARLRRAGTAYMYMVTLGKTAEWAWMEQEYRPTARLCRLVHSLWHKGDFVAIKASTQELLSHAWANLPWLLRNWAAGATEAAALRQDLLRDAQQPQPCSAAAAAAKARALRQLYISLKMQATLAAPARYCELKVLASTWTWWEKANGKAVLQVWQKHHEDMAKRAAKGPEAGTQAAAQPGLHTTSHMPAGLKNILARLNALTQHLNSSRSRSPRSNHNHSPMQAVNTEQRLFSTSCPAAAHPVGGMRPGSPTLRSQSVPCSQHATADQCGWVPPMGAVPMGAGATASRHASPTWAHGKGEAQHCTTGWPAGVKSPEVTCYGHETANTCAEGSSGQPSRQVCSPSAALPTLVRPAASTPTLSSISLGAVGPGRNSSPACSGVCSGQDGAVRVSSAAAPVRPCLSRRTPSPSRLSRNSSPSFTAGSTGTRHDKSPQGQDSTAGGLSVLRAVASNSFTVPSAAALVPAILKPLTAPTGSAGPETAVPNTVMRSSPSCRFPGRSTSSASRLGSPSLQVSAAVLALQHQEQHKLQPATVAHTSPSGSRGLQAFNMLRRAMGATGTGRRRSRSFSAAQLAVSAQEQEDATDGTVRCTSLFSTRPAAAANCVG